MTIKLRKAIAIIYLSIIASCVLLPYTVLAEEADPFADTIVTEDEFAQDTAIDDNASVGDDANSGNNESSGDEKKTDANGAEVVTGSMDTGNAINDIMNNARFEGAVSSIQWLTNIVDKYFAMAITLVSFFIISAALLKNACAGAYCANPKFWDKVSESHQKNMQYTIRTLGLNDPKGIGNKLMDLSPAGIRDFFLGLLPDIKSYTDFENSEGIEPKQYFMHSIPQMIACVIIGVFIYNGYYRDTAAVVGSFGAETFERVMASADPVGLADRLYNMTGTPKVASDYDKTTAGKLQNSITHKTFTLILTEYTDITSTEGKTFVIEKLDQKAKDLASQYSEYTKEEDGKQYNFAVNVFPAASPVEEREQTSEDGNTTTVVKTWNVYEDCALKEYSSKDKQHYAVISMTFTKVNKGAGSAAESGGAGSYIKSDAVTLTIHAEGSMSGTKVTKETTVDLSGAGNITNWTNLPAGMSVDGGKLKIAANTDTAGAGMLAVSTYQRNGQTIAVPVVIKVDSEGSSGASWSEKPELAAEKFSKK